MQSLKTVIQNTPLNISKTYPLSVLTDGQEVDLTPPFSVGDLIKDILGEEPVPAPPGGLVSNSNYFFDDWGNILTGVSVTVNFTTDFISSSNGFGFQLNCYSKEPASPNSTQPEWQQYIIYAAPSSTQLLAWIDNWDGWSGSNAIQLINYRQALANLPSTIIKASYQLKFVLNTDSTGNVTGATYKVIDDAGNSLGAQTLDIIGQPLLNQPPGTTATTANLAPIVAFTFNIGGDYNSARATLTSGAGTITYAASNTLTIVNAEPNYTDFDDGTGESANLTFGALTQTGTGLITQSFSETTDALAPAARHGHALPKP